MKVGYHPYCAAFSADEKNPLCHQYARWQRHSTRYC